MPIYPTIQETARSQQVTDTFGGYNHNLKIPEGEFYEMENLCGDDYPLLATRKQRNTLQAFGQNLQAIVSKGDKLYYIAGYDPTTKTCGFYAGDEKVMDLPNAGGLKRFVSMGAYLLIWPDKVWYNTADGTHGNMEKMFSAAAGTYLFSETNAVSGPDGQETTTVYAIWLGEPCSRDGKTVYTTRETHSVTFGSNRPLGVPDGLALGSVLGGHYEGRIKYLVNDLLMNLSGLAPLFVGINKTGRQSRDFPKMVEAVFNSDNHVIMFPAGICSRKVDGKIQDLDWKKTFITKSIETQRDIVPIHFGGRNSEFFYNLANVTKRLGLKVNLAMLYLVDELYKNQHKTFDIKIGKPISYTQFTTEKTPTQWAALVREIVYKL